MKRLLFALLPAALVASSLAFADDAVLHVGDAAPDFALPWATRDSISFTPLTLSSLEGGKRNIVIAFYPADWSGGCTKEVCTLRDNFTQLGALNANVVAMSGDYVFSHHEWAVHHDLPFVLASDHDHTVAKRYGSYNAGAGFNKRTVFVVNPSGKITYIDMQYSSRDSVSFMKLETALKNIH
jgi:peroxiredoxin